MYIKIGNKSNPANAKVVSGFVAETPIAKISSVTVIYGAKYGTPDSLWTKEGVQIPSPRVTLNVVYFKSYEDYLAGESEILINNLPYNPAVSESNEPVLQTGYYDLDFSGLVVDDATLYNLLKTKLLEKFTSVTVVEEK